MMENSEPSIQIDLNEFKLHLHLHNKTQRTFHFDSPSRRFYLSVIALVVNEMKKMGKIKSIPLLKHLDLLVLVNESIGGAAGSSDKENLLPRIYRKWKSALPNLEEAPLFKVLGKKKEEGDGAIGKIYSFTDAEKDRWANLFEYKGSDENVRLKFAIDKMGVTLNETSIIFEDLLNGDAWDQFITSLKEGGEGKPEPVEENVIPEPAQAPFSPAKNEKFAWLAQNRWVVLVAAVAILAGALAIWKTYLSPGIKVASVNRMQYPLPDKPSIAVLPFVNMSKDPEQEFFSDGLTEEIITNLSRSPYLFVIARTSTFKYKGRPVEVSQISEELGVQYVLEGSVRRSREKVRITAQLIDGVKGHHLWAERFEREIREIFTVQDEIALKIVRTLHVKMQAGQVGSETGRGAKNLDVFLKSMEAREQILRYTRESNARARKLFEEVIALDPNYARGYSGLAISYASEVWLDTSKSPRESLAKAIGFAEKAVFLDESDATAHAALAYLLGMTRQYDSAIAQAERALALDPNSYSVINNCGIALAYSGKHGEALPLLEKAARMNPAMAQSFVVSSMAYRIVGRYDKAREQANKAVELDTKSPLAQIALAATSILTGREEEARAAAAEVLKINPTFSVEQYGKALPFKDKSQVNLMTDALRKAGLK
jgi:adenylate cyclase